MGRLFPVDILSHGKTCCRTFRFHTFYFMYFIHKITIICQPNPFENFPIVLVVYTDKVILINAL